MRGRTNVTQRSGTVQVNGQIKEYEVADGNTISVGDFVSFSKNIEDPVVVENFTNNLFSQKIYIDDSTYILIVDGSKLSVIKNGVVVDSLSSFIFVYLSVSNKVLAIDSNNNISVYKFDVITNKLILQYTKSNVEIYNTYNNTYKNLFELNGHLLSLTYSSSSGSSAKLFSVTDEDIVLLQTVKLSSRYYFNGTGVGFYRNGVLSIFNSYMDSSGDTTISYFKLGDDNIIVEDGYISVNNLFTGLNSFKKIRQISIIDSNSYLVQFSDVQAVTYGGNAETLFVFLRYNNLNKIEVEYNFKPSGYIGTSASSYDYPYKTDGKLISIITLGNDKFLGLTSTVLMNNSFVIGTSKGEDAQQNKSIMLYCIYEIQNGNLIQTSNWMELISLRDVVLKSRYYTIKYLRPDVSYFIKNGSEYKIIFGITSGSISASTDDNYYLSQLLSINLSVKNDNVADISNKVSLYNGGAIGFAKTGGTAGQTIQVYVPNES